jgi:hypothetical protein
MKPYLLAGCLFLYAAPGCNLPPLPHVAEARAAPCPDAPKCPESSTPAPPAPSVWERVAQGGARLRAGLAAGHARACETVQAVVMPVTEVVVNSVCVVAATLWWACFP